MTGAASAESQPRKTSALNTILFGTGTNYIRVFVRLVGGIFTFRLLFETLGAQDFGFYQLMWSTIGYAVLLDFGFGTSVQRAIAATVDSDDDNARQQRREAISTVFWSYAGLDLLLAIILVCGGSRLLHGLRFDSLASIDRYRPIALIFGVGVFAAFPFGIFREALRGQGRIHVSNFIDTSFAALQAMVVIFGCLHHWSLAWLSAAAMGLVVLPTWVTMLVAVRHPDLRPRLRDFRWRRMRSLSTFSLYAYVITMTNMIMSQCDQLVIGAMVSVQAIALYIPGAKLAQVYGSLALQMQDTLGPVAARLGGLVDKVERASALKQLLLNSQRWSVMIGTLLVLPLLVDMRGAITFITSDKSPDSVTLQVAYCLVLALYLWTVCTVCTRRVLMMIDHHRAMLAFSIVEATVNLGLSLYLTWHWKNSVGAAAGTLCASLLVSAFTVPVYGCKVLGLAIRDFLAASGRGALANLGAFAAAAFWWGLVPRWNSTAHFLVGCLFCAAAGIPGWWRFGILAPERERVSSAWAQLRRPPMSPNAAGAQANDAS